MAKVKPKWYYIYHIPGKKVGCTKFPRKRADRYQEKWGYRPEMLLLQKIPISRGDVAAGNLEKKWALKLGYSPGVFYADAIENQRLGGLKGGFATMSDKKRLEVAKTGGKACAEQGKSGLKHLTTGERSLNAKKLIAFGISGFKAENKVKCPHCGKKGHLAIMKAWHFNRCSKNPRGAADKSEMSFLKTGKCRHCKVEMSLASLGRWHNDHCKKRK